MSTAKPVWIGALGDDTHLVSRVVTVLESIGVAPDARAFTILPTGEPLSQLLAQLGKVYLNVVLLLGQDEGREKEVARAAQVQAQLNPNARFALHALDGTPFSDDEILPFCRTSFPQMDFRIRRLLRVQDSFFVGGRGLIVSPDFPPSLLPGATGRNLELMLRSPDGTEHVVRARSEMPFVTPLRPDPKERPGALLLLDAAKSEVPPDTEVWTTS